MQGEALYIAMAGQHQIWRHDLRAGTTRAFSGDGYERTANGRSGPGPSGAQGPDDKSMPGAACTLQPQAATVITPELPSCMAVAPSGAWE